LPELFIPLLLFLTVIQPAAVALRHVFAAALVVSRLAAAAARTVQQLEQLPDAVRLLLQLPNVRRLNRIK
jgi:hypothetical protein